MNRTMCMSETLGGFRSQSAYSFRRDSSLIHVTSRAELARSRSLATGVDSSRARAASDIDLETCDGGASRGLETWSGAAVCNPLTVLRSRALAFRPS